MADNFFYSESSGWHVIDENFVSWLPADCVEKTEAEHKAFIESLSAPLTGNDLINQKIAELRETITDDIRDRAALGDAADLKAIYDAINALKSQLT